MPTSRAGMESAITVNAKAIKPPPPIPCTTRAPIRVGKSTAKVHIAEPTIKIPMLILSMRTRPNRSLNLPYTGNTAVAASK
ncbi:Uncharacterised protein [Vibrio cholerae]|nr:Uncharacterised protein [Vibrio cholerae]